MMKFLYFLLIFNLSFANSVFSTHKIKNNFIYIYLNNKNLYDITFKYDSSYNNLLPLDNLPVIGVIRGGSKKLVATFTILEKNYSLKNRYKWVLGNKNSFHNNSYLYRLPCKLRASCLVSQGFNGDFTHKGDSKYAVDFAMRVGTKIYASRGGVVVDVKQNNNKNGSSKEFAKFANYITIKHNDGTYGKYAHLKKNGVVVKVGDIVKRGDFIGYSGNTGYTNGPHLHFIVFKAKDYKSRESIKIKFISKKGVVLNPKKGDRYIVVP